MKNKAIRQHNIEMFANVDTDMASRIADIIGVDRPTGAHVPVTASSPALSMMNTPHSAKTQKVGMLIGNGFDDKEVDATLKALAQSGAFVDVISDKLAPLAGASGGKIEVDETFVTAHPALYDALYIVGGTSGMQASFDQEVVEFFKHAYKYFKPIGGATAAQAYVQLTTQNNATGVVMASSSADFGKDFVAAITKKRFWDRT